MSHNVGAVKHDTHSDTNVEFDELPDACPICHAFIQPIRMSSAVYIDRSTHSALDITYRCSRQQCGRMFVGRYLKPHNSNVMEFRDARYIARIPENLQSGPGGGRERPRRNRGDRFSEIAGISYQRFLRVASCGQSGRDKKLTAWNCHQNLR
jgi:hypothetical protein